MSLVHSYIIKCRNVKIFYRRIKIMFFCDKIPSGKNYTYAFLEGSPFTAFVHSRSGFLFSPDMIQVSICNT